MINENQASLVLEKSISEVHTHSVNCVLCFTKKIVSCSSDKSVLILDLSSYRFLASVGTHEEEIHHLLKWNDDTFLVCSENEPVRSYNLLSKTPFYKLDKEIDVGFAGAMRTLKLRQDTFLCITYSNEFLIISYSLNQVQKILTTERVSLSSIPLLSKKYSNCFFLNSRDVGKTIFLINYLQNEVEKVFMRHDQNEIYSCCTYLNSRDEEILVCGGLSKLVYLYNTHLKEKDENYVRTIRVGDYILSSSTFRFGDHQYMQFGHYGGEVSIYEVMFEKSKDTGYRRILKHQAHSDQVLGVSLIQKTFTIILTFSGDHSIRFFELTNLAGMKDGLIVTPYLKEYNEAFTDREILIPEIEPPEEEVEVESANEEMGILTGKWEDSIKNEKSSLETRSSILERIEKNISERRKKKKKELEEQEKELNFGSKSEKIGTVSPGLKKTIKKETPTKKKTSKRLKKDAFESFFERQFERKRKKEIKRKNKDRFFLPGPGRYTPTNYLLDRTEFQVGSSKKYRGESLSSPGKWSKKEKNRTKKRF